MSNFMFMLFIAGMNTKSKRALKNIKSILSKMNIDYDLITINLLENIQIAETTRIVATPMLIRTKPGPIMRFVGDFSNLESDLIVS
ncbi:MAG: circadian clock protein KaiB [Candidatus Lokiarchaeota archaeon]|nr:circadian clock protein KaiB [Candidatus Lokiarchaeota archaeon]MBD3343300.1 circadian clock protein KaiB [Candidatus Lokiarchaeota archaeon]